MSTIPSIATSVVGASPGGGGGGEEEESFFTLSTSAPMDPFEDWLTHRSEKGPRHGGMRHGGQYHREREPRSIAPAPPLMSPSSSPSKGRTTASATAPSTTGETSKKNNNMTSGRAAALQLQAHYRHLLHVAQLPVPSDPHPTTTRVFYPPPTVTLPNAVVVANTLLVKYGGLTPVVAAAAAATSPTTAVSTAAAAAVPPASLARDSSRTTRRSTTLAGGTVRGSSPRSPDTCNGGASATPIVAVTAAAVPPLDELVFGVVPSDLFYRTVDRSVILVPSPLEVYLQHCATVREMACMLADTGTAPVPAVDVPMFHHESYHTPAPAAEPLLSSSRSSSRSWCCGLPSPADWIAALMMDRPSSRQQGGAAGDGGGALLGPQPTPCHPANILQEVVCRQLSRTPDGFRRPESVAVIGAVGVASSSSRQGSKAGGAAGAPFPAAPHCLQRTLLDEYHPWDLRLFTMSPNRSSHVITVSASMPSSLVPLAPNSASGAGAPAGGMVMGTMSLAEATSTTTAETKMARTAASASVSALGGPPVAITAAATMGLWGMRPIVRTIASSILTHTTAPEPESAGATIATYQRFTLLSNEPLSAGRRHPFGGQEEDEEEVEGGSPTGAGPSPTAITSMVTVRYSFLRVLVLCGVGLGAAAGGGVLRRRRTGCCSRTFVSPTSSSSALRCGKVEEGGGDGSEEVCSLALAELLHVLICSSENTFLLQPQQRPAGIAAMVRPAPHARTAPNSTAATRRQSPNRPNHHINKNAAKAEPTRQQAVLATHYSAFPFLEEMDLANNGLGAGDAAALLEALARTSQSLAALDHGSGSGGQHAGRHSAFLLSFLERSHPVMRIERNTKWVVSADLATRCGDESPKSEEELEDGHHPERDGTAKYPTNNTCNSSNNDDTTDIEDEEEEDFPPCTPSRNAYMMGDTASSSVVKSVNASKSPHRHRPFVLNTTASSISTATAASQHRHFACFPTLCKLGLGGNPDISADQLLAVDLQIRARRTFAAEPPPPTGGSGTSSSPQGRHRIPDTRCDADDDGVGYARPPVPESHLMEEPSFPRSSHHTPRRRLRHRLIPREIFFAHLATFDALMDASSAQIDLSQLRRTLPHAADALVRFCQGQLQATLMAASTHTHQREDAKLELKQALVQQRARSHQQTEDDDDDGHPIAPSAAMRASAVSLPAAAATSPKLRPSAFYIGKINQKINVLTYLCCVLTTALGVGGASGLGALGAAKASPRSVGGRFGPGGSSAGGDKITSRGAVHGEEGEGGSVEGGFVGTHEKKPSADDRPSLSAPNTPQSSKRGGAAPVSAPTPPQLPHEEKSNANANKSLDGGGGGGGSFTGGTTAYYALGPLSSGFGLSSSSSLLGAGGASSSRGGARLPSAAQALSRPTMLTHLTVPCGASSGAFAATASSYGVVPLAPPASSGHRHSGDAILSATVDIGTFDRRHGGGGGATSPSTSGTRNRDSGGRSPSPRVGTCFSARMPTLSSTLRSASDSVVAALSASYGGDASVVSGKDATAAATATPMSPPCSATATTTTSGGRAPYRPHYYTTLDVLHSLAVYSTFSPVTGSSGGVRLHGGGKNNNTQPTNSISSSTVHSGNSALSKMVKPDSDVLAQSPSSTSPHAPTRGPPMRSEDVLAAAGFKPADRYVAAGSTNSAAAGGPMTHSVHAYRTYNSFFYGTPDPPRPAVATARSGAAPNTAVAAGCSEIKPSNTRIRPTSTPTSPPRVILSGGPHHTVPELSAVAVADSALPITRQWGPFLVFAKAASVLAAEERTQEKSKTFFATEVNEETTGGPSSVSALHRHRDYESEGDWRTHGAVDTRRDTGSVFKPPALVPHERSSHQDVLGRRTNHKRDKRGSSALSPRTPTKTRREGRGGDIQGTTPSHGAAVTTTASGTLVHAVPPGTATTATASSTRVVSGPATHTSSSPAAASSAAAPSSSHLVSASMLPRGVRHEDLDSLAKAFRQLDDDKDGFVTARCLCDTSSGAAADADRVRIAEILSRLPTYHHVFFPPPPRPPPPRRGADDGNLLLASQEEQHPPHKSPHPRHSHTSHGASSSPPPASSPTTLPATLTVRSGMNTSQAQAEPDEDVFAALLDFGTYVTLTLPYLRLRRFNRRYQKD